MSTWARSWAIDSIIITDLAVAGHISKLDTFSNYINVYYLTLGLALPLTTCTLLLP